MLRHFTAEHFGQCDAIAWMTWHWWWSLGATMKCCGQHWDSCSRSAVASGFLCIKRDTRWSYGSNWR
jgi:hypothetical protein